MQPSLIGIEKNNDDDGDDDDGWTIDGWIGQLVAVFLRRTSLHLCRRFRKQTEFITNRYSK